MESKRTVISLFTGAGGLDLGLESAGFQIRLCVEMDERARETVRANRHRWRLSAEGDAHKARPADLLREAGLRERQVTVLSGGPPCQPFSKSAYWVNGGTRRLADGRANTLRAYLSVAEAVLPRVLLLENVRGLAYDRKDEAVQLLRDGLASINRRRHTNYRPHVFHINAAHYGVPQIRERVFLVASIDGQPFEVPPITHGDGEGVEPIRTAWDAIGDVDREDWPEELGPTGKWAGLIASIPEGQNYLWHTPHGGGQPLFGWRTRYWSFLLKLAKGQPSWTIQADPGPATGPFHWRNRLLSVEELCRLQTFPKGYRVVGSYRVARRQLGNAVPCAIGELLGREIRRQILREAIPQGPLSLVPRHRSDCPRRERVARVSRQYHALCGPHHDHPGVGRGPGTTRVRAKDAPRTVQTEPEVPDLRLRRHRTVPISISRGGDLL